MEKAFKNMEIYDYENALIDFDRVLEIEPDDSR